MIVLGSDLTSEDEEGQAALLNLLATTGQICFCLELDLEIDFAFIRSSRDHHVILRFNHDLEGVMIFQISNDLSLIAFGKGVAVLK